MAVLGISGVSVMLVKIVFVGYRTFNEGKISKSNSQSNFSGVLGTVFNIYISVPASLGFHFSLFTFHCLLLTAH